MSVEYQPSVGRVSAKCRSSVGIASVEYRPTLSVECRWSISRDIDRHLGRYSPDILHPHTRPILDRHLGRHLLERSTDIWSSIGRHALQVGRPLVATIGPYLVGMSVYTRPTRRPLCYDELSAAYRSTVGGILCIVNRLFCWNILKCQPFPPLNPQGTQKNSIYRLCPYGDRVYTAILPLSSVEVLNKWPNGY